MMDEDRDFCIGITAFSMGLLLGFALGAVTIVKVMPDIPVDDVYRFCMVKNIPLEECKIPPKPYMKGTE